MKYRPFPKLQKERAFRFIWSIMNSPKGFVAVALLLLVGISFNWFANETANYITNSWPLTGKAFLVSTFPLTVGLLFLVGLFAYRSSDLPIIRHDPKPAQAKALILFLSPPGRGLDAINAVISGTKVGNLKDLSFRSEVQDGWRMILEAVAFHQERLSHVIIIESADSPEKTDGTWRFWEGEAGKPSFKDFHEKVSPDAGYKIHRLEDMDGFDSTGVDFEDPGDVMAALHRIYDFLHGEGVADRDILVDITGGQKLNSIAGAIMSFEIARQFQYISTRSYAVYTYDLKLPKE